VNPVSSPTAPHSAPHHAGHESPGEGPPGTVREHHDHHELGFIRKYIFSTDHKIIGLQFMFSGLAFLVLGGLLAMAIRFQLAWPWKTMPGLSWLFPATGGAITPEFYTMLFTMHGTVMIFFVIIPLLTGAFGNFLIPLMIGAPDMAFPKLNMFGYWAMIPAFACAITGFFVEGGAAAAGWTAYPPLSTIHSAAPGSMSGQTWWLLALTFVGLSSMMGAVNYVTTIVKMRAPGMTMFRMPLAVWGLFGLLCFGTLLVAAICRDPFGRLVAVGIAALLFAQMTVNTGMTIGVLPITGMTLPFVSYGGSSLVSTWLMLGVVLSIAARPAQSLVRTAFEFDDDEEDA